MSDEGKERTIYAYFMNKFTWQTPWILLLGNAKSFVDASFTHLTSFGNAKSFVAGFICLELKTKMVPRWTR